VVTAEEIVLAMLRSGRVDESLVGLVEAYGDQRALQMRAAAGQVADSLDAPLIAVAIQRLPIREPAAEAVLASQR
jgi:hypothetical protein